MGGPTQSIKEIDGNSEESESLNGYQETEEPKKEQKFKQDRVI